MSNIFNLSGSAGSTYAPLRPPRGVPQDFLHGPFAAELSPSIHARARGAYPDQLTIGFLVSLPDPDGCGGVELDHLGYRRQAVELLARNDTHLAISRPLLFEIFRCPPVVSAALFDGSGAVVAHGVLRGRSTDVSAPSRFEFPSYQVLVRKV